MLTFGFAAIDIAYRLNTRRNHVYCNVQFVQADIFITRTTRVEGPGHEWLVTSLDSRLVVGD